MSTYLWGAFYCMLLSCHGRLSEWIHTQRLPECQETPSLKQEPNLKFKWQQRDSKPQPLSSKTNTQPFSETGQMIKLCSEYLSVRCIWLYVIIMSCMSFRVNPNSIVCLNGKELLAQRRCHIGSLSGAKVIWTHSHLVRKWTLNHLAKLVKWLSCAVSIYLYGPFVFVFLSCHMQVSEWIHAL